MATRRRTPSGAGARRASRPRAALPRRPRVPALTPSTVLLAGAALQVIGGLVVLVLHHPAFGAVARPFTLADPGWALVCTGVLLTVTASMWLVHEDRHLPALVRMLMIAALVVGAAVTTAQVISITVGAR